MLKYRTILAGAGIAAAAFGADQLCKAIVRKNAGKQAGRQTGKQHGLQPERHSERLHRTRKSRYAEVTHGGGQSVNVQAADSRTPEEPPQRTQESSAQMPEQKWLQAVKKLLGKTEIRLTYAENPGFALNKGSRHPAVVKGVSLAVAAACAAAFFPVMREGTAVQKAGASLLLGGGLSNTCDRLVRGKVTDYIGIGRVIYNIADFAILAGMLMTVLPEFGQISSH